MSITNLALPIFAQALLFSALSFASTPTPASLSCGANSLSTDGLYDLPGSGYWMQFGGDRYLSYTSDGGADSKMYDIKLRQQVPTTSSNVDGALLPEGDLYVQPAPLRFYRTSDALKQGNAATPLFTDEVADGNYQSVGTTSVDGNTRNLRILVGSTKTIHDYSVKKDSESYAIEATGSANSVCENLMGWKQDLKDLEYRFKVARSHNRTSEVRKLRDQIKALKADPGSIEVEIPILSRDGQMLAFKDYHTSMTKIARIDLPSGNCNIIASVPSETNKVQFSYDGKKVLYTVKDPATGTGRLLETEIKTGKSRVLSGPGEDIMYQGYKPDGTILYTRRVSQMQDGNSDLVMLKPNTVPFQGDAAAENLTTLGQAWAAACDLEIDDATATAVGSRLDPKTCNFIFSPENNKNLVSIANIAKPMELTELRALCSDSNRRQGATVAR